MQFVLAQSDLFHLLKNRERKKKISLNWKGITFSRWWGFCFSLGWEGRQQLRNNKSIICQNALVLKHFVSLSFVLGRPFMLPEDRLYFSLTLLQRLIVSAQLQQQPQVQQQYLQTAQPPNGQPSMPTKHVVHLLQKHVHRVRLSRVLDPTADHSLLLPEKYAGGDRPDHLDLPPPAPYLTTSMVWGLQANPPRSHWLLPWQSVYFHFPAHGFSSFPSPS